MKLLRSLPPRFKVDVKIAPGTHASEEAVNKQVCSHDVSFDYKVEAHNAKLSQQRFLHCCLTKETSEHIWNILTAGWQGESSRCPGELPPLRSSQSVPSHARRGLRWIQIAPQKNKHPFQIKSDRKKKDSASAGLANQYCVAQKSLPVGLRTEYLWQRDTVGWLIQIRI